MERRLRFCFLGAAIIAMAMAILFKVFLKEENYIWMIIETSIPFLISGIELEIIKKNSQKKSKNTRSFLLKIGASMLAVAMIMIFVTGVFLSLDDWQTHSKVVALSFTISMFIHAIFSEDF